jgi:tetratricopeptide (TPR) repeat protein
MLRDMEKSLADLNHTMELRPRYADALLNRAMVHFDMTQFELALKDLEEVLRIQPGNEMATQYVRVLKRVRDGPAWPKTYKAASAHYAVSTDVDQSAANLATLDLERIYAEYARQFQIKDTDQKRKLNVRIFSTQEGFLEYGHETFVQAHEGVVGYYSKIFKELVILNHSDRRQVTKTIYHEGFHQFMDYFISSAPPWFDEGLANYFELSQWTGRSFDLGAVSPAMLRTIQDGITYNLCVPLAKLLRLSRDEFADPQPTSRPNVPKYRVHYA